MNQWIHKNKPLVPSSNEKGNISEKGQSCVSIRVCPSFVLKKIVYCKCNLTTLLEKTEPYLNHSYRKGAQLFPWCSYSGLRSTKSTKSIKTQPSKSTKIKNALKNI